MSKSRFVVPALCLAFFGASVPGLQVQARQVPSPPSKTLLSQPSILDSFPYDAARRGPLLLLSGPLRSGVKKF